MRPSVSKHNIMDLDMQRDVDMYYCCGLFLYCFVCQVRSVFVVDQATDRYQSVHCLLPDCGCCLPRTDFSFPSAFPSHRPRWLDMYCMMFKWTFSFSSATDPHIPPATSLHPLPALHSIPLWGYVCYLCLNISQIPVWLWTLLELFQFPKYCFTYSF